MFILVYQRCRFSLLTKLCVFMLLLGCKVSHQKKLQKKNPQKPLLEVEKISARVSKKAQQIYLKEITAKKAEVSESWALFSYSGWSNVGHYYIYRTTNDTYFVYYAEPNTTEFKEITQKVRQDWQKFQDLVAATATIADFKSKALDGIEYEFMTIKKRNAEFVATQRLYMNNPELISDKNSIYLRLIRFFEALKAPRSK